MLILSRRIGETIKIGEDIEIVIVGAHANQVRVGVKAPTQVAVHRQEVYERIAEERMGLRPARMGR